MNNKLIGLAALVSAGVASVCCVGPLIVTALGLGSLGLATGLTKYRPFFLILTGVALAIAFYLANWKRTVSCADGSCEFRSGSRAMKAGVWAVAALAAALATFPNWSGRLVSGGPDAVPADARVMVLKISGMDCAACTVAIERSVERVPGVHSAAVDFDGGRARVVAGAEADSKAVLAAVAATGYKAELMDGGGDERRAP